MTSALFTPFTRRDCARWDIVIEVGRVFLSHASVDKPAVRRIATALRAAGHDAWLDEEQILVGESIPAAVERGLRDADFVVICLSKAAAERGWIEAERDAAVMHQFREGRERILPVRLEEVAPPYLIASRAYVDLFPDGDAFTQGIARLARSIEAHEARHAGSARPSERQSDGPAGSSAASAASARTADGTEPTAGAAMARRSTARRAATPTPVYSSAEVQVASERLEGARARKQTLHDAGIATGEVDREILELRRQLRDGGQLRAGDSLGDGRYLLIKPVGRGGFAVVWEGYDRKEQVRVAIKVLHTHLAGDPQRRERFFRGARVMMDLAHPAVARVHEPRGYDDAFCYFVMELVPGGNLRDAVLGKRVEVRQRWQLVLEVGEALAEAHRQQLVHRDIKPSNILLDEHGHAKLTDFDLVGAQDTTGGTRTGALGTVVYAAPECLDKPQEATARADVFGLGMTAIFCLSGRDLSMATFRDPGRAVAQLDCAVSVQQVLQRAVAWEPELRYADAATMVEALRAALAGSAQGASADGERATQMRLVMEKERAVWTVPADAAVTLPGKPSQPDETERAAPPPPPPPPPPRPQPWRPSNAAVTPPRKPRQPDGTQTARAAPPRPPSRPQPWRPSNDAVMPPEKPRQPAGPPRTARDEPNGPAAERDRRVLGALERGFMKEGVVTVEVTDDRTRGEGSVEADEEFPGGNIEKLPISRVMKAPRWAAASGTDQHGLWVALEVKGVQQRMRWIPPGTFRMGSPTTELGRYDREGPQHEVTLTRGYWLGETPVTQALWVAVMGGNPSHFRGDQPEDLQRPVERVSWDDCQAFLERLNAQVTGLAARLPTEAEWEQACRAGTISATWVGELSGDKTAPELDAIAWYGGNSDGQSHPVGRKAPNPYGLHDMLGNVVEWCADAAPGDGGLRPYGPGSVTDPVCADQGPSRVLRGGSWYGDARRVRAAYRYALPRGFRSIYLGFRLAGGQVSAPR